MLEKRVPHLTEANPDAPDITEINPDHWETKLIKFSTKTFMRLKKLWQKSNKKK